MPKRKKNPTDNELTRRLAEAEEIIEAIKFNKIDALLISTKDGEQVWTLKDSERPYRIIIEQMSDGAVTIANDGIILFSNTKFANLLKAPLGRVTNSSFFKWVAISDLNSLNDFLQRNNDNSKVELDLLSSEGEQIPVLITLSKLNIENAEPVNCLIATDLTEQRRNQEISAAENLSRSIIEQSGEAIIVCDTESKIIRVSKGAETLAGENLLHKKFDSVFRFEKENEGRVSLTSAIDQNLPYQTEITYLRSDGQVYNLIFSINILSGPQNNILGYIINLTNITKRVHEEERISASLRQKTTLLKEIHHRIKNNLQIVSSLLNIQSSYIKETHIQSIFQECRQRIASMALIHQKLYESKSLSEINISDYVKDLIGFLCNTYLFSSSNVRFNNPKEEYFFSIEKSVPMGLILNELITNSIKHAFPDKRAGKISINMGSDKESNFVISIKDDGVGIPKEIDLANSDTLGLQLVHTLIDQVSGSIELVRNGGTEFIVKVPMG